MLPVKLLSPPYTAVIGWFAALRALVLYVACPFMSVPVPIVAPLSLNVTMPVGVPVPGALTLTVAVNITLWPTVDGFTEEMIPVVVDAWFTTCDNDPVLGL